MARLVSQVIWRGGIWQRVQAGLRLSVMADGSGTMTGAVSGAFAPFSVTIDGSGTMTATGG